MKYGATGSAARDKRRAARVRGQKAGRQRQHRPPQSRRPPFDFFEKGLRLAKFKFRSRRALDLARKSTKVTKMWLSQIDKVNQAGFELSPETCPSAAP